MDANNEDPVTMSEVDEVLTEWFHDLYILRGGGCRSYAEDAVSGIHLLVPSVKGHLHQAKLALKGWSKLVPSIPHPPLTWDMTVCIGVRLACRGRFSMGVATLLAFDCYLRVGELVGLTRSDVADAGDRRRGSSHRTMELRLKHTKTGKNQSVSVRDPAVIALVRQVLATVSNRPSARLFPYSSSTFRRHFKAAAADLGLSEDFVPHSLRHGGATRDEARGMTVEEVMRRGRWASTKSARHYIQSGRALLLNNSIPDAIYDLGQLLVSNIEESFSLSQNH